MAQIPHHVWQNREETSNLLSQAKALLTGATFLTTSDEIFNPSSEECGAFHGLVQMALEKLEEVEKAHDAEWAAFQAQPRRSPEESAEAQGETA